MNTCDPTLSNQPSLSDEDFDRLLLETMPAMMNFARKLTVRNPSLRDDLLQDTAARALWFKSQFQAGTNFQHWVFRIMYSLFCAQYNRYQTYLLKVQELVPEVEASRAAAGADVALLERELSPGLTRAILSLNPSLREAVIVFNLGERTQKEAADYIGIPIRTLGTRVHRAHAALRRKLNRTERARRSKAQR